MNMPELLQTFLLWGVYPAWLLAGAGDYLCHRRTDIEHTSGAKESWLHLAQFLTLLIALAAASRARLALVVVFAIRKLS